jgi:hypothetical protein
MPILRHLIATYGPRKLNIILTQLRCNASFLNYDVKFIFYQMLPVTVAHHMKILAISSLIVINIQLNLLLFNTNIDVNLLTKGSDFLTYQENITIFKHVFKYIKTQQRHTIV